MIGFLMVAVNFILYVLFGILVTGMGSLKKSEIMEGVSLASPGSKVSEIILAGFFFYYALFTLFAVPVTYRWRPLSMLSNLWCIAVAVVTVLSLIVGRKRYAEAVRTLVAGTRNIRELVIRSDDKDNGKNRDKINSSMIWFAAAVIVLLAIELTVVLYSYQFTLDAAYYVANVTTSLQTNSLNIYDPYTGDWQDHFEMRYFFATYPLQDAVMCYVTGIPALIQTKIIMASVSILLTNMLYYMIGRELFGEGRRRAVFLMMAFAGLVNFFFSTIYTTSTFLTTRTYEGKCILGNVVLPAIFYIYIKIIRAKDKACGWWAFLFLVAFGSTVISNSSNMLVPAALGVLFVPVAVRQLLKRDIKGAVLTVVRMGVCMLPGLILMLTYVAYVHGKFVFYTYPK